MKNRSTRQCRLAFTDERFVYAKRSYPGVPLLIDEDNEFVDPVCDYLRSLIVYEHLSPSSARTYAESLLHFWNFLTSKGLPYYKVTDDTLIEWINSQKDVKNGTKAARCDSVFDLYVWLEKEGYVSRMVRIPGFNDQVAFRPCLSAKLARPNAAHRASSRHGMLSAVRPRQQAEPPLPTPEGSDIGRLHAAVDASAGTDSAERNHLLLDWYLQTGIRRMEWRSLSVSQIPKWEEIDAARDNNHALEVLLTTTKGGRSRHTGVLPELLERTREYIEGPRAQLVARFRAKLGVAYREPPEIFLSNKTGGPLEVRAISNLLRNLFELGRVEGHGHRLRATFLTRLFEAELMMEESRIASHPDYKRQMDFDLLLRRVAERAGHRHIDSLRPYLVMARKRHARSPISEQLLTLQQRLDAKLDELAHAEALLKARRADVESYAESRNGQ